MTNKKEIIAVDNYKENIFNKNFVKMVSVLVIILTFGIGILATFLSAHFTNLYNESCESIRYKFDNVLINILLTILFLFILYFVYKVLKKIKTKHLLSIILTFTLIIGVSWVLISKSPVKVDQKMVSIIATEFLQNDFSSFNKAGYMSYHPLQIGIVFFVEFIYRIFGQANPIYFQLLNVLFTACCIYLLYKICNKLFKDEMVNKILLILTTGFLHLTLLNVYVYGNLVGLCLSLIAVYFTLKYIEKRKLWYFIIISISISIAIVLKSNYQIYLIGIIITLIMDFISKKDKKVIFGIISIILLVFISGQIVVKLMEYRMNKKVESGIPMVSYIYMGLKNPIDRSAGWYNGDYDVDVERNLEANNFNTEETSKNAKIKIKLRVKEMVLNPGNTVLFFGDKIASTWIEPAFQMLYINKPSEEYDSVKNYVDNNKFLISVYDGKISKMLLYYFDVLQITVFLTTSFYIAKNIKSMNYKNSILILMFLGGFVFHVIWETKSSYVIIYYFLLLPYCAIGLKNIFEFLERKFIKNGGKENG
jgi:4-amino-4-deoxy-L-arabinose transferase-like glycosyltransferase